MTETLVNYNPCFCSWLHALVGLYNYFLLLPTAYFLHPQKAPQLILVLFLEE